MRKPREAQTSDQGHLLGSPGNTSVLGILWTPSFPRAFCPVPSGKFVWDPSAYGVTLIALEPKENKLTLSSWLTPALTRSLTERVGGCLSLPAVVEECWCGRWNIGHMETGYSLLTVLWSPTINTSPFPGP